jgi:hypothetical protein
MALHRFFVFGVLLLGVSVSQALRVDRVEEQAVESVAGVAASVEDAAPKRRRNSTTNRTSLLSKPKVAGGDETWKWHEVEASGIVPNAREGHTMVAVEDFLVLFGGCYLDKKCFNDVHLYVPTTRRWLKPYVEGIPPAEREGHTATLVGAVMYIFGGSSQLGYLRDVASLNLQPQGRGGSTANGMHGEEVSLQWGYPDISGIAPDAREGHSASRYASRIYYFGGYTDAGYSDQLVVLDTDSMVWEYPNVGAGQKPPKREGHVTVQRGERMFIQGGFTNGGCLADTWVFDRLTNAWEKANTRGVTPTTRENSAAVNVDDKMLLVGGCNFGKRQCHCDMHVLDTKSYVWKEETVGKLEGKSVSPRESHTLTSLRGEIFLFGGCYLGQRCFNDMFQLTRKGGPVVCGDTERSCSRHGECRSYFSPVKNMTVYGCACRPGWSGDACENRVSCPSNCSGHGLCRQNHRCACQFGWAGRTCARQVACPGVARGKAGLVYGNCSGHGVCQQNGMCLCNEGWGGEGCEVTRRCNSGCSGHGLCVETSSPASKLPPMADPFEKKNGTGRGNATAVAGANRTNGTTAAFAAMPKFKRVDSSLIDGDAGDRKEEYVPWDNVDSKVSSAAMFLEESKDGASQLLAGQKPSRKKRKRRKRRKVAPTWLPDTFCQCYLKWYGDDCSDRTPPKTPSLNIENATRGTASKNASNASVAAPIAKKPASTSSMLTSAVTMHQSSILGGGVASNEVSGKGCPNHCSSQGICVSDACYCHHGFTGNSCSLKMSEGATFQTSFVASGLYKYSGSFFFFGIGAAVFSGRIANFYRRVAGIKRKLPTHQIPLQKHW